MHDRSSRFLNLAAGVAAIVVCLCCPQRTTDAKERELSLTLRFVPQETIGAHSPSGTAVSAVPPVRLLLKDARSEADKQLVGRGQGDDDESLPVRATDDVGEFCGNVLLQVAAEWGLKVADDADLLLEVRLVHFFVTESDKAVGSTYNSDARVEYVLMVNDTETRYGGSAGGGTSRYGRSRNTQNINEVLSDALKEAYANMFDDPHLRGALLGKNPDAQDPPAGSNAPRSSDAGVTPPHLAGSSAAISAADLLAELIELKKGALSTDFLVAYIRKRSLTGALTTADIVAWKDAGMPESVIEAAIDLPVAGTDR